MLLWGGWLVVTGATFILGHWIIHPYYAVALAPALGALVGIGGVVLWRRRHELAARIAVSTAIAVTAWWTLQLLDRSPTWNVWLQPLVVATGVVGTIGVLAAPYVGRGLRTAVLATAVIGGLAAPTAASIATAATAHDGAVPRPARWWPAGSGAHEARTGLPPTAVASRAVAAHQTARPAARPEAGAEAGAGVGASCSPARRAPS